MTNLIAKIFGYKVDPEVLHSYRTVIPDTLNFHWDKDEEGVFFIQITEINDKPLDKKILLVSEAKDQSGILPAVHDLVMSYYDVPEAIRPYYEKDLVLHGNLTQNASLVKA